MIVIGLCRRDWITRRQGSAGARVAATNIRLVALLYVVCEGAKEVQVASPVSRVGVASACAGVAVRVATGRGAWAWRRLCAPLRAGECRGDSTVVTIVSRLTCHHVSRVRLSQGAGTRVRRKFKFQLEFWQIMRNQEHGSERSQGRRVD